MFFVHIVYYNCSRPGKRPSPDLIMHTKLLILAALTFNLSLITNDSLLNRIFCAKLIKQLR